MAFPRTESGLFPSPSHGDFGQDIALVAQKMSDAGQNSNSIFDTKISDYTCAMGHSMGGGAAVLASSQSTIFDCYLGLAPAETNPSAIAAAANLQIPSLILSGSNDGVTPPSQHHLPIFNAIPQECKSFANLIGGGHCYFANSNFNCDFGESTSSTGISLSRSEQQSLMYQQITPWLSYFLGQSCEGYASFMEYPVTGIALSSTCPNSIPDVTITQNNNILSTTTHGSAYQWYLNGAPIVGQTNDSLEVVDNFSGVYQLLVYFDYGCQFSNNIAQLNEFSLDLKIYPNPAREFIEINGSKTNFNTFHMLNLQGKIVKSGTLNFSKTKIELQDLSTGTYLLEICGTQKAHYKVLIQR
jgi:hypothetical protein